MEREIVSVAIAAELSKGETGARAIKLGRDALYRLREGVALYQERSAETDSLSLEIVQALGGEAGWLK
jgi:hypothetical protein